MTPKSSPIFCSDFDPCFVHPLPSGRFFESSESDQGNRLQALMTVDAATELPASLIHSGVLRMTNSFAGLVSPSLRAGTAVLSEKRPRILVVDDEPLHLDLIADILGDDYDILVTTDAIDGLEIAAKQIPHLILLDVMMPVIDGFEMYKCLKADPRACDVPVIFITGRGDVAAEAEGLKLGAVDYITKPINRDLVKARVSMQINFKLMRDKLAALAATDGLTGLANRAHFDSMLAYEHARHLRGSGELSLIMLDIDHFKAYNDNNGHVRGDECLREIAQAMARTVTRATDLVARYGGEEFVVLLPETPLRGAVIVAERIRKSINDLCLPRNTTSTRCVTASLGVVSGRLSPGTSMMDVVREADIQLYSAKAAGRNRVKFRALEALDLAH